MKDTEKIIGLLARMPLLKMFNTEQLQQILGYTSIHVYEFGESVIEEGGSDQSLFILISGSTRVLKSGAPIGRLNTMGDIFGEMSLVDGSARSASIVAEERTICLRIKSEFLLGFENTAEAMLSQNIVFRALAGILAQRLRQMNVEMLNLKKELEAAKGGREAGS